jgi:hypothetical protein
MLNFVSAGPRYIGIIDTLFIAQRYQWHRSPTELVEYRREFEARFEKAHVSVAQ